MEIYEGIHRIAIVIRVFGWLTVIAALVGAIVAGEGHAWGPLVFGAIIAVPLLAIAWIVDGFTASHRKEAAELKRITEEMHRNARLGSAYATRQADDELLQMVHDLPGTASKHT